MLVRRLQTSYMLLQSVVLWMMTLRLMDVASVLPRCGLLVRGAAAALPDLLPFVLVVACVVAMLGVLLVSAFGSGRHGEEVSPWGRARPARFPPSATP